MKKGEIWRVSLPFGPGHTQAGDRPAVIVQDDAFNISLPTILVVPFTGTLAASRFAGTLVVQPDTQNGLNVPSVALVFQLSALDKRDCLRRLGMLDRNAFDQLLTLLDRLTTR